MDVALLAGWSGPMTLLGVALPGRNQSPRSPAASRRGRWWWWPHAASSTSTSTQCVALCPECCRTRGDQQHVAACLPGRSVGRSAGISDPDHIRQRASQSEKYAWTTRRFAPWLFRQGHATAETFWWWADMHATTARNERPPPPPPAAGLAMITRLLARASGPGPPAA